MSAVPIRIDCYQCSDGSFRFTSPDHVGLETKGADLDDALSLFIEGYLTKFPYHIGVEVDLIMRSVDALGKEIVAK